MMRLKAIAMLFILTPVVNAAGPMFQHSTKSDTPWGSAVVPQQSVSIAPAAPGRRGGDVRRGDMPQMVIDDSALAVTGPLSELVVPDPAMPMFDVRPMASQMLTEQDKTGASTQREFEEVYTRMADKSTATKIFIGAGVPAITPKKVGDIFVSTTTAKIYFSTGTDNSGSWLAVN